MQLSAFYEKVAQKLHIIGVAEPLSAEDAAVIADAYASLWASLEHEQLTTWDVSEDIPDRLVLILVDMLAAHLVDVFEVPEPRRSQIRVESLFGAAPVTTGERRLRQAMAGAYVADPVNMDYF